MDIKALAKRIKAIFAAPTISEIINAELQQAIIEKEQAEKIIESHRFLKHMAEAKIAALNSWTSRNYQ